MPFMVLGVLEDVLPFWREICCWKMCPVVIPWNFLELMKPKATSNLALERRGSRGKAVCI